eukprot:TRINITY_DN12538_c0_g1_i1.p1 TRINITY_DN12538_c0_g1~~TRINITY_DN12538_c0_g1_i1.p1  ORF type:complete len:364 (+),score=89.11 TRINITY_DN12538_c0_g1_i1:42-1133(+)
MAKQKAKKPAEEKKAGEAEKEKAPVAASSSPASLPQAQRRRVKKRGCCPEWLGWVMVSVIVMGVMPVVILSLPLLVPPVDDVDGRLTMVGGGGFHGVRGLWSVFNRFGTMFCTEHGAKDTVKCHFNVMYMSVAMLRAPGLVDFYTAIPQDGLSEKNLPQYKNAVSPLRIDKQWEEFTADPLGANPSQVAKIVLDLQDESKARYNPIATVNAPFTDTVTSLEDSVGFIKCQDEFDKIFGKKRAPLLGASLAKPGRLTPQDATAVTTHFTETLWNGKTRKTIYVFGIESAIAIASSIPSSLSDSLPINIVILPLADGGHHWYLSTRGREPCTSETFRKAYDSAFHYFAWVIRGPNEKLQQLPKTK